MDKDTGLWNGPGLIFVLDQHLELQDLVRQNSKKDITQYIFFGVLLDAILDELQPLCGANFLDFFPREEFGFVI
jgi:hypothetical protein